MKKLNILLIGLFILTGFYSCQEDEIVKINPEAEAGTLSFIVNKSVYDNFTHVLIEDNNELAMDTLYAQQPDYGFTAAVTYYIDASFNPDMSGSVQLANPAYGEKIPIVTKDMAKAMLALYNNIDPNGMPKPTVAKDVYLRLRAEVSNSTKKPYPIDSIPTVKSAFSNIIKLNVQPYYIPSLVSYDNAKILKPYYIIGLGDGKWTNDISGVGVSIIPMSVVTGLKYDAEGNGTWKFTGYFEASKGFKLIRDFGNWNEQWGNSGGDGINSPIHNDGGSGNFKVPADGYYTITLNSIANDLKIEADVAPSTSYTSMGILGEFNNWGSDEMMAPFQTTNNHVWYLTKTFTSNGNFLFRAEADWGKKFGSPSTVTNGDPLYQKVALGVAGGGKDILQLSGDYVLIINDIDGCYWQIKK